MVVQMLSMGILAPAVAIRDECLDVERNPLISMGMQLLHSSQSQATKDSASHPSSHRHFVGYVGLIGLKIVAKAVYQRYPPPPCIIHGLPAPILLSIGLKKKTESEEVRWWDFSLGTSMFDFVLVIAKDSRCHLAVARNAIRLHHHHGLTAAALFHCTARSSETCRRDCIRITYLKICHLE